jgi:hypothetical protein
LSALASDGEEFKRRFTSKKQFPEIPGSWSMSGAAKHSATLSWFRRER